MAGEDTVLQPGVVVEVALVVRIALAVPLPVNRP